MNNLNQPTKLLSCQSVSIGYENKTIVRDLTFDINQGDYICVIGENGSGKTTLLKTILGLQSIVNGTIERDKDALAGSIGYLPQQNLIQRDFPASVQEVVLSGFLNACKLRPFYKKSEKAKAIEYMELLHIENLRNKCYRELSGGQQQRVLLARALCAAKKLLVLDEPVTGLDPHAAKELYELLKLLCKTRDITILMVSHDLPNVLNQADTFLYLSGNGWFLGSREYYLANCNESNTNESKFLEVN